MRFEPNPYKDSEMHQSPFYQFMVDSSHFSDLIRFIYTFLRILQRTVYYSHAVDEDRMFLVPKILILIDLSLSNICVSDM